MTTTRPVGTGRWAGAPTAWREPWEVLALDISPLPAGTPLERLVAPLVENLARASGAGCVALWLPGGPAAGGGAVPSTWLAGVPVPAASRETADSPVSAASGGLSMPDSPSVPDGEAAGWLPLLVRCAGQDGGDTAEPCPGPVPTVGDLRYVPGVQRLTQLTDGQSAIGVITIGRPGHLGDLLPGIPEQVLAQTRDCLTLVLREFLLGQALRGQKARADQLDARLAWVQTELTRACDTERRRLAGWVLAGATRALADVTRCWRECALALRDDPPGPLGPLREMRSALDVLVDDFRLVARAVHPSTLRGRGTVAALGELAARLPRGAHLAGDLGRRVGWEVESGIYHAAAAVLTAMSSTPGPELVVRFARADGRLVVRVDDPVPRPRAEVWAGLAEDARRLAALGGGLRYEVGADGTGSVELWLPEHLLAVGEVPVQ